MGTIVAGLWTLLKTSKLARAGATILLLLAVGAGLYFAGVLKGEDKAETRTVKEELRKVGVAREGAEKVERRIDDKDDRALIECMRAGNC